MKNLARLLAYRELLYMLTLRDIKIRYKQSVMGILWAILMPILIIGSGVVIRFGFAEFSHTAVTRQDIMSIIVRAVAWAFFVSALRFGTNSLVNNSMLVSRVAFPKEVFPIGAVLSNLIDFLVAAAVALVVLIVFSGLSAYALLAPALILLEALLLLGLVLVLSSLNLFYRDVKYLVEIMLTYAIFFTPVLYSADMLGRWRNLILLNPVAPILEGLTDVLVLNRAPSAAWLAYSTVVTAVFLVGGYWLFKQLEAKFAERI